MANKQEPRLRTVQKFKPPYPLNKFPKDFPVRLGREILYIIATRRTPRLEGTDFEEIFASAIGAEWKPSNVGLDDIVLEQSAWGAKTVYCPKPSTATKVRLISGRNSPIYSFGAKKITDAEPEELGEQILSIWNERVSAVRKKFKHLRTIVLLKSSSLLEVALFEFDTIRYEPAEYTWRWNKQKNLEGCDKYGVHCFTWQPHGAQFTILESVPKDRLAFKIKKPPRLNPDIVLKKLKFDPSWIEVI